MNYLKHQSGEIVTVGLQITDLLTDGTEINDGSISWEEMSREEAIEFMNSPYKKFSHFVTGRPVFDYCISIKK